MLVTNRLDIKLRWN